MTKPRPYQIGDEVRILAPKIVRRVGYPLHFRDPAIQQMIINRLNANVIEAVTGVRSTVIPRALIDGAAKAYVELQKFGGPERGIHYFEVGEPVPESPFSQIQEGWSERTRVYDCTGLTTTVLGKCTRMTGTRFPGGPAGYYGGEWENGGLADQKAHVFLYTHYGWIEQTDVELVTESNGHMLGYNGEYRI